MRALTFVAVSVFVSTCMWKITRSNGSPVYYDVKADTEEAVARTSDKFVSLAEDSGTIANHWKAYDPTSPLAIYLARALSPAYFRYGGTTGDALIFVGQEHKTFAVPNTTFTASDWDRLNTFTRQSNFSLFFGLNSLYRRPGAAWDPSNAIELLKYSAQKGYVMDLELGNEPDIYPKMYGRYVDPTQLADDFGTLRGIMNSMPAFRYSQLTGPDPSSDNDISYIEKFMATGSQYIDSMTFHHYYFNGKTARAEYFIDPNILDSLKYYLSNAQRILNNSSRGTQTFWLGETSSAYNGGAPGLSDTFLAGFLWLDKLGLAARYGVKVVMRQQWVELNYGLVEYNNGIYTPNPDYWLTLLYKTLVGEIVLRTQAIDNRIRVYAHCTSNRSGYGTGSVTFYVMNLYSTMKTVSFSQFPGKEFHIYTLSSGDANRLITKSVQLNNELLALINNKLPPLPPVVQTSSTIQMAPFTMSFVVVPEARASACL